jgi:hypothetical protein
MRQPIALRSDYDATLLRNVAPESEDPDQVRRLMTLAMIMLAPAARRQPRPAV